MKNISLYFKEGSSDKEYHIQIEQSKNGFVVNFQYGRVGNALQVGTKTSTPVTIDEAEKIYGKLLKEKTAKGYSEGDSKNDFSEVSIIRPKEVIILPQLLNAIEDVEEYINDDSYLAQEKMDGERRIVMAGERIIGLNKKGQEVPLPNSIIKSLSVECIVDGELIGNELFIFDLISLNGVSIKENQCIDRIAMLNTTNFSGLNIVKTAYSREDKRMLFERLKSENKEGIVFKKKSSSYTHGRPASGGNQLKFKFYKTATFIVANSTVGKRSVGLELVNDNARVFMGKVTIPPNHFIPNVGDFVEVRYLYAYRGGAIFQPVYLGKRNDSDLTDARIGQIIYKGNT